MATATPNRSMNVAQEHARIRSPLERLRKFIRAYVTLEGLGLGLLFLAVWFWVGLAFDWGLFKLFTIDLVQQLPWGFRAFVLVGLCGLLVALLAFTVLMRLLVQFSDKVMAQVLEHRFPNLLGDRLITAVELNDPAAAAEFGYSPAMVRQTIAEAAEQVEKVPVKEAFNWSRLVARGVTFVALSIGLYLLVGVGVLLISPLVSPTNARAGFSDLNETSSIWVERNILLRNTIWPRRAHLEIVDFPTELRIPKKSAPPVLRVRAWKYVMADSAKPEGWRRVTWGDLPEGTAALPKDWGMGEDAAVDDVEQRLEAFPVRALTPGDDVPAKWCVPTGDPDAPWRPLMWSDLTAERLGGLEVPALPGDWDPKGKIAAGLALLKPDPLGGAARQLIGPKFISLRVDDVEKKLADAGEDAKALDGVRMVFARLNRLGEVRSAIEELDARASDRANSRKLRRLVVPATARLVFISRLERREVSMVREGETEFTGNFGELDEPVTFNVYAEDYVTPTQRINVVDRPQVERMESQELRPAYLYYRPGPDGNPDVMELVGKRQPFAPMPVSVMSETTNVDVPVGTTLTLIAYVTKPLTAVTIEAEEKDRKTLVAGQVEFEEGGRELRCTFPNVRREQKFTFKFTDDDQVTSERKVLITPRPDVPAAIREFGPDEVIRRDKGLYVITANARVPFKGRVTDDLGLAKVSYGCRVIPSDFLSEQKVRSLDGVRVVGLSTSPLNMLGSALPWLRKVRKDAADAAGDEGVVEQTIDVAAFGRAVRGNRSKDGSQEYLTLETIRSRLASPHRGPARELLKNFVLAPDTWTDSDGDEANNPNRWTTPEDREKAPLGGDLGVWLLRYRDKDGKTLPLKETDEAKPQKRFNVEVRLVVEDTYIEGDVDENKRPMPHVTPSVETFIFTVVPENELLALIGAEQENQHRALLKSYKPLPENRDRVRDMTFALSAELPTADLNNFIARCDTLAEALKSSEQEARAVKQVYERIVREMRLNQVNTAMQNKVFKGVYMPLERVVEVNFDRTNKAIDELRKRLSAMEATRAEREKAAQTAKQEMDELVSALDSVLQAMEGVNTLTKLIEEIVRIEKQEQDLQRIVDEVRRRRLRELLKD